MSDAADVPAQFDELDALHRAIALALAAQLAGRDVVGWSECRLMVQYFDHSTQTSFRHLLDGVMGGVALDDAELVAQYKERFDELTGLELARFRLSLTSDGKFNVTYFYDNVDGNVTWVFPDEEGYLTPKELRERDFRPVLT